MGSSPRLNLLRVCLGSIAGLALVVIMLAIAPWLGAVLSLVAFVALVPLGSDRASDRLVAAALLGCGALALALAVGDVGDFRVLSPERLRAALAVPAVVAAAVVISSAARARRLPVARADLGLIPLLLVAVAAWCGAGLPALGVDFGQAVGGLMSRGWDHQSHFSIFSFLYDQGGVWRPSGSESASMFLGYPPLAGAIGVSITMLVEPNNLGPVQQLPYYIQATAMTFGIGAGLLAWTAGSVGRRVTDLTAHKERAGSIALVSGLVVGGYVLLGPAFAFFDYGFTNFFFAIALATAASWLTIAELRSHVALSSTLAVATTASLGQLWTPLVVLMVPAGLVQIIRLVRGRLWWSCALAAVVALVGGWVVAWQVFRIAPAGEQATSLAQAFASAGGGQPAAPLPHLVALAVLGVAAAVFMGPGRKVPVWVPLAAPLAGALIALGFVINTARSGFAISTSYYVAKSVWIIYLTLLPVAGGAVAVGALALLQHDRKQTLWGSRARVAAAGVIAASLVWSTTPTQNAVGAVTDYYATPVGGQAVPDRWSAFRDVPQGDVVSRAQQVARRWPSRLAIAWESGNLLTNRWLASFRRDLDPHTDMILTALPEPYAEPARDALAGALTADPDLELVIVVSSPDSRVLLKPLTQRFPDRVVVRGG